MAQPITWRNVNSASQSDAFNFTRLGTQQINRGLSGFQNQITGIAEAQEQEAFDNALAQINGLNTVDAVRQAQSGNFLDTISGGDTNLANRLQGALDNRGNDLRQQFTTDINFNEAVLNENEKGTVAQLRESIANRDLTGIDTALNGLSANTRAQFAPQVQGLRDRLTVGKLISDLTTDNIEESQKTFDGLSDDLKGEYANQFQANVDRVNKERIFGGLQSDLSSVQDARDRHALDNFLTDNPEYDGEVFINNGELSLTNATPDDDAFVNKLFSDNATTYYSGAPDYDDTINSFRDNSSGLSLEELTQGLEYANQFAASDPRYVDRVTEEANRKRINEQLQIFDVQDAIKNNPGIGEQFTEFADAVSVQEVYDRFDPLMVGEEGVLFDSSGDKEKFVKTADSVVKTKFKDANGVEKDYAPAAVGAALSMTTAVLKAHKSKALGSESLKQEFINNPENQWITDLLKGTNIGLGVFLSEAAIGKGDNIDKTEFKRLLNEMQTKYEKGVLNERENTALRRSLIERGLQFQDL